MATVTKTKLKILPLAERVAIRPTEETQERKGGLYIPDTAKEKPIQGEVIAGGPGRMEKGQRVPMERSEEHTTELQSHHDIVCRLLPEKKKRRPQRREASFGGTFPGALRDPS